LNKGAVQKQCTEKEKLNPASVTLTNFQITVSLHRQLLSKIAINVSKKPVNRSRPYGKWMIFIKLSNSTALIEKL
jgi:hypothetical protein